MLKRISLAVVVFSLVVSQIACGPLARLDSVLPYVPRVIDYAVSSGRISAVLGDKLKDDIDSGTHIVARTKKCLVDNLKPDSLCYVDMGNSWREVIGRNHVAEANDPKVTVIFGLITEIVTLLVSKHNQPAGVRGGPNYDRLIKERIDRLEQEVKVPQVPGQ